MVLAAFASFLPQCSPVNMGLHDVALERVTNNNAKYVAGAAASHLPRDDKNQVMGKRAWWKAIVRLLGKKGQGLHAEIRGTTDKEVQDRAKEFYHI